MECLEPNTKLPEVMIKESLPLGEPCTISDENSCPNCLPNGTWVRNPWGEGAVCMPNGCEYITYIVQQNNLAQQFECTLDETQRRSGVCPSQRLKQLDPNAKSGTITKWNEYTGEIDDCSSDTCANGYTKMAGFDRCVNKCPCYQELSTDGKSCVPWTDKCSENMAQDFPNAISVKRVCAGDGKSDFCQIQQCANGYEHDKKNNKCVEKYVASDQEIEKMRGDVDAARANEHSLENRINDAIGIGGVGIGGMMIGGALGEQAADKYAESDMAAYINTFRCEYGNGQSV